MGLFRKKAADRDIALLSGSGNYAYRNVVGESHYRKELMQIIAQAPAEERENGEVFMQALLVKEPTNAFDPKAIMVLVDMKKVGYIGRDETAPFHRLMNDMGKRGLSSDQVGCLALIGWNEKNADPVIGVRLDFDPTD